MTLDEEGPDGLKTSCWEYTLHRSEETCRVKRWIRGGTKIGPVLDVKVCYHQGRYGVEIKIEFSFGDKTCSWVRNVNGNQQIRHRSVRRDSRCKCWREEYRKLVAEAKPRETSNLSLSLVSILYRERKWIDVEPGQFSQGCSEVSKIHDQIVTTLWYSSSRRWWSCKFWRPGTQVQGKVWWYFAMASWSLDNFLGKRRTTEEKVSVVFWTLILPNVSCISEQSRDMQEVLSLILHCKTMYCCRMTSPSTSST